MNLYAAITSRIDSPDAHALSGRLAEWHDAMVAHERHLRRAEKPAACGEDCPHAEARLLWAEALIAYGEAAHEPAFLRATTLAIAA
jgi:hypothetical protein